MDNALKYDFPLRGISIVSDRNNVFMIKNIDDTSKHGNIGLFAIAAYDSQFTLKWYYSVPLWPYQALDKHGEWISQKWLEFCELNQIKNHEKQPKWTQYSSVSKATRFPKKCCEMNNFLEWLQKNQ